MHYLVLLFCQGNRLVSSSAIPDNYAFALSFLLLLPFPRVYSSIVRISLSLRLLRKKRHGIASAMQRVNTVDLEPFCGRLKNFWEQLCEVLSTDDV